MNEELLKVLKNLPKPFLTALIYKLMVDGNISYHELMDMHIKNLERMAKGETEAYFRLQAKVVNLWCDYKKNIPDNLNDIKLHLYNEGRINLSKYDIEELNKWKENRLCQEQNK